MFGSTLLERGKESPAGGICQFPWCKWSHCGFFSANRCVTTGYTAGKRWVQIWWASMGWLKHRVADSDFLLGLIVLHKPTQPYKETISKPHTRQMVPTPGYHVSRLLCSTPAHGLNAGLVPPGHHLPDCSLSMWSTHRSLLCRNPSHLASLWLCSVITGCADHLSSSSSLWLHLHLFTPQNSLCVNPEVGIQCLPWSLSPLI